jgi:Uma2 family endonuclease
MIQSFHLTLSEYDTMVKLGAFDHVDRKVELIRGELVEMNPAGPVHDDFVTYLNNWSFRSSDPVVTVITSQTGLDLPERESRSEPDVFWIKAKRYRDRHPQAEDVQLAIEVADASLAKDLEVKRTLYAEVMIVDIGLSIVVLTASTFFANRMGETIRSDLSSQPVTNSVL